MTVKAFLPSLLILLSAGGAAVGGDFLSRWGWAMAAAADTARGGAGCGEDDAFGAVNLANGALAFEVSHAHPTPSTRR